MLLLSSSDLSISLAQASETLVVTEEVSPRLGNTFWTISDEYGLIEVASSKEDVLKFTGMAV